MIQVSVLPDTKLLSDISNVVKGKLARQIFSYKESEATRKSCPR